VEQRVALTSKVGQYWTELGKQLGNHSTFTRSILLNYIVIELIRLLSLFASHVKFYWCEFCNEFTTISNYQTILIVWHHYELSLFNQIYKPTFMQSPTNYTFKLSLLLLHYTLSEKVYHHIFIQNLKVLKI